MVTWHLTMKLFPAKCHEQATLRKLWRQTGNSSLLPAKCWPLLHMIAGMSAQFSNFAFALFCYTCIPSHLMTGPEGNSEFCFPRISMFPKTKSREISRLSVKCNVHDVTSMTNLHITSSFLSDLLKLVSFIVTDIYYMYLVKQKRIFKSY